MTARTFIFNLYGTLTNSDHRADFARLREWESFYALSALDEPHLEMVRLAQTLIAAEQHPASVLVLTDQPQRYWSVALAWLLKHGICADSLLMRPDRDYAKIADMKLARIDEFFGTREAALENVAMIFDTHDFSIEAMRNAGFVCCQVRNPNF